MSNPNETKFLQPSQIRKLVLHHLNKPLILKGYLKKSGKWKCLNWSKDEWTKLLAKQLLDIRFGKKFKKEDKLLYPQWESQSLKGKLSYEELINWENKNTSYETSTSKIVTHDKYWAYFDYHYMKDLLNKEIADNIISWEDFGFPELKASDSTLWIGTTGANTPCHKDAYGCNIVCQIYGKKLWLLFPNDQSNYLYPTRIPYEESSTYSKIGFPAPDMSQFPLAYSASPYMITLEAGDVLLVPKHWWHFVENVTFAISINSWISIPSDSIDELKETIVMYHIGSLCQSITAPPLINDIFNPNALDVATMTSAELLNLLTNKLLQNINSLSKKHDSMDNVQETINENKLLPSRDFLEFNIYPVKKYSFNDYLNLGGEYNEINSNNKSKFDVLKVLIECFTDDRVLEVMKDVLIEKMNPT